MPRSNRPRRARPDRPGREPGPDRPLDEVSLLGHRREDRGDGEWAVRPVTGAGAVKTYRCPGCDQEIRPGTPHVVVWPLDRAVGGGAADRRHWHTPCWARRR